MGLFFNKLEAELIASGGATYAMLTEFIVDWNAESIRWVDKQVSVAIAESPENAGLVNGWFGAWLGQAEEALAPLAGALFDDGPGVMADITQNLKARAAKAGVSA
jgi:phenol hydroxylase P1 protein